MIRAIVAMDRKRGIANKQGIPWDLPSDRKHFRELTKHSDVLMGFNTYSEFRKPLQHRRNYVWCRPSTVLRAGFEPVYDLPAFLNSHSGDLWVIGGGSLFTAALPYCKELHITQLATEFNCTVFFPRFSTDFYRVSESQSQRENNITYTYQTWQANGA